MSSFLLCLKNLVSIIRGNVVIMEIIDERCAPKGRKFSILGKFSEGFCKLKYLCGILLQV